MTITLTEVTTESGSGSIEGSYQTSGGIGCTIQQGGKVDFTR